MMIEHVNGKFEVRIVFETNIHHLFNYVVFVPVENAFYSFMEMFHIKITCWIFNDIFAKGTIPTF